MKTHLTPPHPRRTTIPLITPAVRRPLTEFGLPEMIEIEPIHTCNLRCVMCHVSYEKLSHARLDADVLLRHLRGLEGCYVGVGATHEPAAHPHFGRIIRGLHELGMKIQFTTNGTLFHDRLVQEIADCALDHVTISFDGIRKETYERIRRNADFDRAMSRIRHLREQFAGRSTYFSVNYTLLRSNLDEALAAVEHWDELGFDLIGFILMVIRDSNELLQRESLGGCMDEVNEKLDAVAAAVLNRGLRIVVTSPTYQRPFAVKEKHPGNFFSNFVMSDHPGARLTGHPRSYMQNGSFPGMKVDCRSPFKYVRILYNGDVQLCQQFRIGNIHETPLLDLWFGEEARRVREKVQADASTCHACDYYRFCIKAAEIDLEREENFYAQHVRPTAAAALPQLIEEGYKGFNLVRYRGRIYGLAQALGPFDLFLATDEVIQAHERAGRCVVADSLRAAKVEIDNLGQGASATVASGPAWPASVEGYFQRIAQGFTTETEEGRRLRALYEELGEPVPAPPTAAGVKERIHAN